MPSPIVDADFQKHVIESTTPVVVDFWAPWCGPCKTMLPVMEELEKDYGGKVSFVKMNVDDNPDVPSQFNVMSIPMFIVFKGGKATGTIVGARSREDMQAWIDGSIA